MSINSDQIHRYPGYFLVLVFMLGFLVLSCEEEEENNIKDFYLFPNPYEVGKVGNGGGFKIIFDRVMRYGYCEVRIMNERGDAIWEVKKRIEKEEKEILIGWAGQTSSGYRASPGLYRTRLRVGGEFSGEREIKILVY